ncbi:carbohydrate ABC transporter permease [Candidatus Galacturonibacter soehngenii]|uniref:Carbohydrate ABC transporter permease n=1 Tax=Candidatus Galacturonatibacter soehngenii TaxID=2307010 RepID=A0A7V7UFB5_9FIRM|nr:carbohydrate ABC transporter permease [Candidatus Galacturonibacter soehngenii]KAB1436079.1 carbohydrate ABC transporter permease [Candidatus Galacturonibacter soehngenii]
MKSKKIHDRYATIAMTILFIILAIMIILPIYALFIASFKPGGDLLQYGLNLNLNLERWSLDNYILLFAGKHEYWLWFLNSIILTVISVLSTLAVSAFVGYGFAAYSFKGQNVMFVIVLIILSIPLEVVMLPLYKQMSTWGLMDNYLSVILPFMANASTIFFFRQYLLGIPKSLLEAGRIDGATEYGIFFRLVVPIMKPAFAAMAILNGMSAWNNYLWPLLVIRSSSKYTLTLGLNTLINPYGDNYSLLIVGSFFSIIPIFILFVCFQKYFIEGMTAGAVKG